MSDLAPLTGRAFVFGDDIDTDLLAPGHLMKLSAEDLARHCLEAIDPGFAGAVRPGDFVVAGRNFGLGSSREQAAVSLKLLGVGAVLATGFARIFYRNALNLGLPALFCDWHGIETGDALQVEPMAGRVVNLTKRVTLSARPIPPHLMDMVRAGGLIAQLAARRTAA
jgi:3-isopropylmalate/(R)-2-methylmalate dehydratase small subunit